MSFPFVLVGSVHSMAHCDGFLAETDRMMQGRVQIKMTHSEWGSCPFVFCIWLEELNRER